jgi:predicted ATPase
MVERLGERDPALAACFRLLLDAGQLEPDARHEMRANARIVASKRQTKMAMTAHDIALDPDTAIVLSPPGTCLTNARTSAARQRAETHNLFAPIHAWFTEGFDTRDLTDTKALLDQLS